MAGRVYLVLRDTMLDHFGLVTTRQARELGVDHGALAMMVRAEP